MNHSYIKKYLNMSFVYAIIALVCGVFYREFTKILGFEGKTNLSVMHTHYFILGMFFFLILALFEKSFGFSERKGVHKSVIMYNVGLNITGLAFLIRGLTQALQTPLSKGIDSSISGFAGLGHIILSVCLIIILLIIKKVAILDKN